MSPSWISRLFFLWVTPFIRRNLNRRISENDLLLLPTDISAQQELKALEKLRALPAWKDRPFGLIAFWLYRRQIALLVLMTVPFLFSTLGSPLILRTLIQTLQGGESLTGRFPWNLFVHLGLEGSQSQSIFCAVLLFFSTVITVFLIHHIFYRQLETSLRVKLMLTAVIYQKSLRLSREALHRLGAGFVVNLVSVDVYKVTNLWMLMHSIWFHPMIIVGVMAVLYLMVGKTALIGFASMVAALVVSAVCTRMQSKLRARLVAVNDRRVGITNEILANIRGVKIASRENDLSNRVTVLRDQEIGFNWQIMLLSSLSTLASASSPVVAMGAMFLPIVLEGGALVPAQVFPALALLMSLRFALLILPDTFLLLVETRIALNRIQNFLVQSEADTAASCNSLPVGAISLRQARFVWEKDQTALEGVDVEIRPGELVAVVGEVGSGKTALLLGLLGELVCASGERYIEGDVSYVAQQPWLVSDTIRNNVICERAFDAERYRHALELSQLEFDLSSFPGGDEVEIGERGIALSGGQRQRLALARAYYRWADIVLLDDPLSALDVEVAHRVFDNLVLGAWGAATRILVTHRLEFALKADRVILIENGRVTADGTPEQIIERNRVARALFSAHHDAVTVHVGTSADSARGEEPIDDRDTEAVQKTVTIEDREAGAVQQRVIVDYLKLFAPGMFAVGLVVLFVLRQIVAVGLDLWWAVSAGERRDDSAGFLTGFLVLSALLCLMNFLRAYFVLSRGLIAGRNAHGRLLQGVLGAPMRFFEANPIGRILNRFSRDLDSVDTSLPRSLLDLMICCFDVVTTISIVIFLQPLGALVVLPVLAIYFYLQKIFRPTSREVQRLDSVTRSPIFALLTESLRGVETLRAFRVTAPFTERFSAVLDMNGRALISQVASNRWLGVRLEFLGSLITLTAALSVCFFSHDAMGAALGGFALAYAMSITSSMNWFVRMLSQTENNLTSYERIEYYAHQGRERWEGQLPPTGWPQRGEVVLDQISVRYRPELPRVLNQISAEIKAGERIGIIGRSGSGKTTLTQALFRLLELDGGAIRVDGVDISTLDLRSVRNALTMIPQEPILFSGTIRAHLDPFNQLSDEQLYQALERVELKGMVLQLPEQLATAVSEGGQNFSAGQRQLLCLAQALLKKSRIIILDEATAHVDPKSDQAIQRTIREEFASATQLIIAHRLGTVMDCDRILVFSQGKIVRAVRPDQLGSQDAVELA